jgi:peptide-methionine (R)-S-oxide reductase
MVTSITKTEEQWERELTSEQYRVLRQKGTEAPFSGGYLNDHTPGMFTCAGCGNVLFDAAAKFDSGTGWPSFDQALPGAVEYRDDSTHGMRRTEVVCAECKGHLGHVFDDGPTSTGKRYCMNSVCLLKKET